MTGSFILGSNARVNLATGVSRARVTFLLRFTDLPGTVCARGRVKARRGGARTGRLRLVGGTESGSTLAGTARFRFRGAPRAATLRLRGTWSTGTVEGRAQHPACEALAAALSG